MRLRVAILDYGCGNLASVANAVRKVGGEPVLRAQPDWAYSHLIMPGQGAYRPLQEQVVYWLNQWHTAERPILGICLGMQLMCEESEESPGVKGLGWLPYPVKKLAEGRYPLPHVGWNTATADDGHEADYYFCHSYAVSHGPKGDPWVDNDAWLTRYHNWLFVSAIFQPKLWAVQFHPEKSGAAGLALLADFLRL